jgi:ABC-type transporter Mla subunit MlaD
MPKKLNSPPHTATAAAAMEESLARLHAKLDSFGGQLAKIDGMEQTLGKLVQKNSALREELRKKDTVIDNLSEKVNRLEQTLRANSLRIHGLPVTSSTPPTAVPGIVFKEIITPIFEAAQRCGDLPPATPPPCTSPSAMPSPSPPRRTHTPAL